MRGKEARRQAQSGMHIEFLFNKIYKILWYFCMDCLGRHVCQWRLASIGASGPVHRVKKKMISNLFT